MNNQDIVPRHRNRKKHHPLLIILAALLAMGLIACVLAGIYVAHLAKTLPQITIEDLATAQTSYVLDDQGNRMATLHGGEKRTVVELEEMPQHLKDAVIASEDIRFYEHHGVDLRGIGRAVIVDLKDSIANHSLTFTQGASTITMQLVKNVVEETEKTLPRKIKQALLALEFEKHYSKDEILYYYLNEIYLGPQVYGVETASQYYFSKHVSELTMAESATLAAVLRAPAYHNPYTNPENVVPLRNTILNRMVDYNPAYEAEAAIAKSEPLVVSTAAEEEPAYEFPWFTDAAISEAMSILESMGMDPGKVYTGGLSIYTTIDRNVQSAMERAYADPSNFPESWTGDIVESAMAIVDPYTGAIRGLVGGRVYETRRGFNRATDMKRSSGSTIKPLVTYAPALELGYSANYIINDSPVSYGSWSPKNDDFSYMGHITLRTAVIYSRNVCAVKLFNEIGVYTGWSYANQMGLDLTDNDINLSLTLGGMTYGVNPLQMAAAFATFANAGVYTKPYCVSRICNDHGQIIYTAEPETTQVFSPQTAYLMTDILMDAVNQGTGWQAKVYGWQTAGKTGTNGLPSGEDDPDYWGHSGTKDAWFCGYTPRLSGAVWMGYDEKKDENGNLQYLSNVYGGSYPARLFSTVMEEALTYYDYAYFENPGGIAASEFYNIGGWGDSDDDEDDDDEDDEDKEDEDTDETEPEPEPEPEPDPYYEPEDDYYDDYTDDSWYHDDSDESWDRG